MISGRQVGFTVGSTVGLGSGVTFGSDVNVGKGVTPGSTTGLPPLGGCDEGWAGCGALEGVAVEMWSCSLAC